MMTMLSIEQLKVHEGFSPTIYKCTEGKLTFGYGFNVEAGITEDEAELLLVHRVEQVESRLKQSFSWYTKLNEPRKAVLLNMAYQLGFNGLLKFSKTLALVKMGDYDQASEEMLNSLWARQTPIRAQQLAIQMSTGDW
ncbi:glycoside hydrolase [Pseudoalteromonas sp. S2755]|nr:glycoside hydrolase [Pseudoalteromonas sp. S2755]